MGAFLHGIEPGDGHDPRRVLVDQWHSALLAPQNLIVEECDECDRAPAERNDPCGDAARLAADRDGRRARRLRYEQQRVAAGQAAQRPELVAAD